MIEERPPHSLQFLGAAGTVTGSRYLLDVNGRRILIDCGLFQGYKQLRLRNWAPFPVPPISIDTMLLTHAHLDHSGYLPALVRDGFAGRIICTDATAELCGLLLPDSGHLQEEDARYAKRKGFSKHKDPKPLYTVADAETALQRLAPVSFDREFDLGNGLVCQFIPAGHLLGAAQIRLTAGKKIIHFSGDLGRETDPMMRPPAALREADILVCESTYGNRKHAHVDAEDELATAVNRVSARGGVIVIPAFAIGRAQGVMLHIARLMGRGTIPPIPVYLNSPMAVDATDIYHRYHAEHHVSAEDCRDMFRLAQRITSVEDSKELNTRRGPMIIISASGMLAGGRILHHLASFGPDPRNAILLSGYQAGGTRGATLVGGADHLRIFGREIPIRAEVIQMQSFSGHADADELLAWMRNATRPPAAVYLTHGEPDAADVLRSRIDHELGWNVRAPEHLERIDIEKPA